MSRIQKAEQLLTEMSLAEKVQLLQLIARDLCAAVYQQMNENGTQIFRINADFFAFYLRHLR